jgi:glycosyltransferase involved in cell wall biosynthesis
MSIHNDVIPENKQSEITGGRGDNMLPNPKISVVLPTYNGARFLAESIESVINQTETHWELIIVNDCSTDNTLEIAEKYAKLDSRIRVISNEVNKKLPGALNVGFADARSEYLT